MIIRYTRHAFERIEKYRLTRQSVEQIIACGEEIKEGKQKVKFIFTSKKTRWIVVCGVGENKLIVITVIKTHKR
jgi:bisphosphoglycerate-dependent phosphoglycerate mutase